MGNRPRLRESSHCVETGPLRIVELHRDTLIREGVTMTDQPEFTVSQLAEKIAEEQNADVAFYSGPIEVDTARRFVRACEFRRRRPNLLAIFVTYGGSPDAAYRIARAIQRDYDKFTFYVSGLCKSAGTLIALGAQEIIVSDDGELGPLDAQMSKRDGLYESESGLVVTTALETIQERAYETFSHFFEEFTTGVGSDATLVTASEVAAALTTGLYSKLYEQMDPLHVGEAGRSIVIAKQYGQRLQAKSGNYSARSLDHLISGYPSHGFVIDGEEMENLFRVVRKPNAWERLLALQLGQKACVPSANRDSMRQDFFLSKQLAEPRESNAETDATTSGEAVEGAGKAPAGAGQSSAATTGGD